MAKTLKVLDVHGLGDQRSGEWMKEWEDAVRHVFPRNDNVELQYRHGVTTRQFARLGYDQEPQLLGPTRITKGRVPWLAASQ